MLCGQPCAASYFPFPGPVGRRTAGARERERDDRRNTERHIINLSGPTILAPCQSFAGLLCHRPGLYGVRHYALWLARVVIGYQPAGLAGMRCNDAHRPARTSRFYQSVSSLARFGSIELACQLANTAGPRNIQSTSLVGFRRQPYITYWAG